MEPNNSEDLLRSTLDSSMDMIQVFKAVRNKRDEIIDFIWILNNKASEEIYGDVIGKSLLTLNPGVVEEGTFEIFKNVVKTGEPDRSVRHYVHESFDGWFLQSTVKQGDGVAITTRDITDIKKEGEAPLQRKTLLQGFIDFPKIGAAVDKAVRNDEGQITGFAHESINQGTKAMLGEDFAGRLFTELRISEQNYRALFMSIDEGYLVADVIFDDNSQVIDILFVEANAAAKRIGQRDFTNLRLAEVDPECEAHWYDLYGRVVLTGEPARNIRYVRSHQRWFEFYIARIEGPSSRRVAVVFKDITERKNSDERQTFLLKLSDLLRPLKEPIEIQQTAMRLLTEEFDVMRSMYTEVDIVQERCELTTQYDDDAPPTIKQGLISEFFNEQAAHYRSGKTLIISDTENEAQPEDYRAIDVRAAMEVPLVKGGLLVAIVAVHARTPRNWTRLEVQILEELAERTWVAVERAKVEVTLRESENRFQSIANLVPDLLWESEPEGSTNWYNQRWLEYTGQRLEEAINWRWVEALHPEDREASAKRYAEAAQAAKTIREEHRIRRYDGQYRWFVVNASPVLDEYGQVIKVYGSATDIHDRKQAEQEALANERRQSFLLQLSDSLRPLFNAATIQGTAARLLRERIDAGWCYYNELDETGKVSTVLIDAVREGLPTMVGVHDLSSVPEFISYVRTQKIFKAPDIAKSGLFNEQVAEYYSALGMHSVLGVPIVKEGRLFAFLLVADTQTREWTQEEVELVKEVAERTWNAIVRAQAEMSLKQVQTEYLLRLESEVRDRTAELQESRDQLRSLLDTTLVQMSILKAVRNDQGQVIDLEISAVNHELEKETGRSDLVGKFYAKEYPGIRKIGLFDLITKALETGEPQGTEYFYAHEGFQKWFSCMFVKFSDGVVATNMDISARKHAEEERFKNYVLLKQSEDIALMGTWDFDVLTKSFTWSDGMYRLFNLKKEREISPEIYLEYTTKKGRAAAESLVKRILDGDTDFEETLELNVAGKIRVLHIKAAVVRNKEGHTERVLGVDLDVTAMRVAEEKIRKMEAEQQLEIFRTSLSTLEEERHRISESLHNGIAQLLYGIKINMSGLDIEMPKDEFDGVKADTNKLLTEAIAESRRISHELMPITLEEFGLKTAIDDVCRQLTDCTRFQCRVTGLHQRMEKYLELAIYRTVQELMTNVVKHAKATECNVNIAISSKDISIRVRDNGQGMQTAKARKPGIGLASIRSKIKLLNGEVNIDTECGKGTFIEIIIPKPEKMNTHLL